jgi:hypothetical protein
MSVNGDLWVEREHGRGIDDLAQQSILDRKGDSRSLRYRRQALTKRTVVDEDLAGPEVYPVGASRADHSRYR